jgi:hypothetical protein
MARNGLAYYVLFRIGDVNSFVEQDQGNEIFKSPVPFSTNIRFFFRENFVFLQQKKDFLKPGKRSFVPDRFLKKKIMANQHSPYIFLMLNVI